MANKILLPLACLCFVVAGITLFPLLIPQARTFTSNSLVKDVASVIIAVYGGIASYREYSAKQGKQEQAEEKPKEINVNIKFIKGDKKDGCG